MCVIVVGTSCVNLCCQLLFLYRFFIFIFRIASTWNII